jgi:uncharacterized protein (DUF1778 family)
MARQTTERIAFRLTPVDRKLFDDARALQNDTWRGASHFARHAVMQWARGVVSAARAKTIGQSVAKVAKREQPGQARG